jgi:hypothetical protein
MAEATTKPTQLISNFEVHTRCNRSEDGTVVLGWTGWFLKSKYTGSELPVKHGDVKDMRVVFPDSPWDPDTETNAMFTIDDYVTVDTKCEHTLRMACNYLLREMVGPENNADVKLRRLWRFNVYKGTPTIPDKESVVSVGLGLFDDMDDF